MVYLTCALRKPLHNTLTFLLLFRVGSFAQSTHPTMSIVPNETMQSRRGDIDRYQAGAISRARDFDISLHLLLTSRLFLIFETLGVPIPGLMGDDSGHADRTYRNCPIAETLIFCALGKFDLSQRDVLAVTNVARRGPSSSVNAPRRVLRSPLRILPGAVPASPSMSVSEVRCLPSMAQASGVPP